MNYQEDVKKYALTTANNPQYLFSGLAGEVGEVCSLYAKGIRDKQGVVVSTDLAKELGDVLWFVAMLCNYYGLSMEDVMHYNLDKLEMRKAKGTLSGSGNDR